MKPAILSGVFITLLTLPVLTVSNPLGTWQGDAKKLYVIVDQPTTSTLHGDLTDFTAKLLELQLSDLDQLTVKRIKADPCGQLPLPALEQGFYLIRIVLDVQKQTSQAAAIQQKQTREPEMVLEYELFKYDDRCMRVSSVRSTEPFPERSVMTYLSTMADVLLLRLENDLAPKKAIVGVTILAATNRTTEAAARIKDYVESSLTQTNQFALRDSQAQSKESPDYTIKADVSDPNNRTTVKFSLTTRDGQSYTARPILGPINKRAPANEWSDFYRKAATSAIDLLKDVRYAADLKLSGPLSKERATALLDKANELMCATAIPILDCQQQPQAAIPLLTELTYKKKDDPALAGQLPYLFQLLGKARLEMEEYAKAAEAFENAIAASSGKPDEIVRLSNEAGDAWYLAKDYKKAIARYETSLRISRENPDSVPPWPQTQYGIHLQVAKSYRFNEDRLQALTVLLDDLEKLPPSGDHRPGISDLEEEAKSVVDDIRKHEFAKALAVLEKKKSFKFAADLLVKLSQDAAAYWLTLARQFRSRSDFTSMDETLKQIESLPATTLTPDTKADLLLERGVWLRDNKANKNFDQAEQLMQQAIAIDSSNARRFELAETYYIRGQQAGPKETKDNYDKSADIFAHLVEEHYTAAYSRLRVVNHLRDKDEHSKDLFKSIVEKDADDFSATLNLQYIYKYLAKFDKALELARLIEQKFARPMNVGSIKLDIAETYLLNGLLGDAEQRLAAAFQKHVFSSSNRAVLLFYQLWASLGQNKPDDAKHADAEWRKAMEAVRKDDELIRWNLDAAKHRLNKEDTVSPERRATLAAMIEAMQDKTKPLPAFTP